MGEAIDLTGQRFGRLTVLKRVPKPKHLKANTVYWLCKCDCGSDAKIIAGCNLKGTTKSCGCMYRERKGESGSKNGNWKGGRIKSEGYVSLRMPEHPNAKKTKGNKKGYVKEHVYIMSKYLGRALGEGECVHHKNGIKDDNRIENLELCTTKSHHNGKKINDLIIF